MKRLIFTLIGVLALSSSYAIKVQSEVYGVLLNEDDKIGCYQMVHLFYNDEGTFLGYGTSISGTCSLGADIQFEPNELVQNQIAEIKAFTLSGTFTESQIDAIAVYNAGNETGFMDLKASLSNKKDIVTLAFNSTQKGTGSLTVVPLVGGNIVRQKVNVLSGENSIEVVLDQATIGYGPVFYLITLVTEEEVFRTIANLN